MQLILNAWFVNNSINWAQELGVIKRRPCMLCRAVVNSDYATEGAMRGALSVVVGKRKDEKALKPGSCPDQACLGR